jgi:hypothetical protein
MSSFQTCWNFFFLTIGSDSIESGRRPVKKNNFLTNIFIVEFILIYERNHQKKFFQLCGVLTKISQKLFLGICDVPILIP